MSNTGSFGEQVVAFNKQLEFTGTLPEGFAVINPFLENAETIPTMERFYRKFYGDRKSRKFTRTAHEHAEVSFSPDWCKGHVDGHGERILATFERRWQEVEGQTT